jgi:ssDNA-binding Zn-finger/Zn-ribbon topoisomerase 1
MSTEKKEHIQPCDQCGGKGRLVGSKAKGYYMACLNPKCSRQHQTCCYKKPRGAVEEWNDRMLTPPKVEVTEEKLRVAWDKAIVPLMPRAEISSTFEALKKELGL